MALSTNLSDASSPNASRSWAQELQWEEDEGFLVAEVRYAFIVAYALVCLFGVAGNSAVLVAVWRHRGRCSAMSILVGNLALADVLVALLCAPFTLASTLLDRWAFGPALCRAVPFLQCLAVMVSTLMLMSIAALRCRVISRPLATQPRGRSGLAWSGAAWLLGACVCAPVPAFYALQDMGEATGLSSMRSRYACVESWPRAADRVCFSVALLTLQYVIPLACLTASHTRVCVRLSSTTAAAAAAAAAASASASAAASVIPQTRITLVAVSAQENRIPGGGDGDHDDDGEDDDDDGAGGAKRGWEGFLQRQQRSWCGRRLSSITPMLGTKRSCAGRQGPVGVTVAAAPVSRTASSRLSEQSAHSMPGISEICCEVAPALTTTPIGPERLSLHHHHQHHQHHHHQHHHQQHQQQQQQEQDQQHEQSRGHEQHWARASSRRKRRRSRTVYCKSLAVILAFALSWLPLHVFHLVTDFDDSLLDNGAFKLVFCTCHLLGMISCCLNPVLYGFLNNGLKKELLTAVRCARPRKLPG
ncbi:neuropeptide Y receptor type 5 [Petromyzon marinus]|uniref:Neuropeptide Y receptor type 5 n=2 Tax=Petromyzon marinus TaxID=7757 RepID=A0AAJ7X8D6_PETMA|nr:neuropeptide Y receptor type 5 [Petromyzon marinus]